MTLNPLLLDTDNLDSSQSHLERPSDYTVKHTYKQLCFGCCGLRRFFAFILYRCVIIDHAQLVLLGVEMAGVVFWLSKHYLIKVNWRFDAQL